MKWGVNFIVSYEVEASSKWEAVEIAEQIFSADTHFEYDIDEQLEHALSPGAEKAIFRFFEKDKHTGCSSFTTINNKTYHKNNQICDTFMNKTFCGEIKITERDPWKNTLEKVTRCMVNREWQE